jgi:hypothetical protein
MSSELVFLAVCDYVAFISMHEVWNPRTHELQMVPLGHHFWEWISQLAILLGVQHRTSSTLFPIFEELISGPFSIAHTLEYRLHDMFTAVRGYF